MGSHGQIPLLLLPVACLAAVHLFSLLCSIPYHFFFFFLINRYLRSVQVFALTKLYCWEHSSTSLQTNTSNTLPKVSCWLLSTSPTLLACQRVFQNTCANLHFHLQSRTISFIAVQRQYSI